MMRANEIDVKDHGFAIMESCKDVWKPRHKETDDYAIDDHIMHKYLVTFVRTFVSEMTADAMNRMYNQQKDLFGENDGSN